MKKSIFPIAIALFFFSSCNKESDELTVDKPVSNSKNKIMPLGASRVEGNRPEYESYRYELWKDLVAGGHTFDFIGTQTDAGSYPKINGNSFDPDHEGYGGATSADLLSGINSRLQLDIPDIVLFSSPGGNDALEALPISNAIANINAIIDAIQSANPNVTIIIEQLAPGKNSIMTPALRSYMELLQAEVLVIAQNQSTTNSKVIPVDMYTGFTQNMLADDVHYNAAGAQFIADRYYGVLVGELR